MSQNISIFTIAKINVAKNFQILPLVAKINVAKINVAKINVAKINVALINGFSVV